MPEVKEITAVQLDSAGFITEKSEEISRIVGQGVAINALSGGVDSSAVTMLGHKALGDRLKTYFIDNGIMREGEPLVQLRKDRVRKLAEALGLPVSIYNRMPFPGPALSARVIGEATPERITLVRKATVILEQELAAVKAFQYMAILHNDRVPGMRNNKREYGFQIEVRCWDTIDARQARPTQLPFSLLEKLAGRLVTEVPGVVSVTYNIAAKPPSTMEAV